MEELSRKFRTDVENLINDAEIMSLFASPRLDWKNSLKKLIIRKLKEIEEAEAEDTTL